MTEQQIQSKMIKYIVSRGGYVVNGNYSRAGIPDLICCYNGRFVAIEVKKPETKKNLSKLQSYNINLINELGGVATMCYNIDMVEKLLDSLDG